MYTTHRLVNHPYSQCYVINTDDTMVFVSYRTAVLVYNKTSRTITCNGTYSATTRKQIGWFLRENFPQLSYYDMKQIAGTGAVLLV